jgi:HEAT repeat protein
MSMMSIVVLVVLLPLFQTEAVQTASTMQPDVDRLVRAAETLAGTWPSQPPPPIPDVAIVARHGKAVVPLLMVLPSDDPHAERDRKRWKVQQQVALTLSQIYSESQHCGRTYCDGDPPERIGRVRAGWLNVIASDKEMQALSSRELLDRFKRENVFWRQFEIAQVLAAANNRGVIAELEVWLTHDDRHLRGNAAFVLGRLGDPRGFETIAAILADRSPRSAGQGIPGGNWTVQAQIRADRYYAAHLLGDLKDSRGVDLLIPLLNDEDVHYIVPWSLAKIGDRRAIGPLTRQTERDDPSVRVLAIDALEKLTAPEALPRLRELLQDNRRANFGDRTTVAEAARHAIAVIAELP